MLNSVILIVLFSILFFDECKVLRNISYSHKTENKKRGFLFFLPLLLKKKRFEGRTYVKKNNINSSYTYDYYDFMKNGKGSIGPFTYKSNKRRVHKLYVYNKSEKKDETYHDIINNHINIISERIVGDEKNFILPNYCLIESNKFYEDYDYQTSILIYLENYLKSKNVTFHDIMKSKKMCDDDEYVDMRNYVISYLQNECSDIIDHLHISENGILNIRINKNSLMRKIRDFYNMNILKSNNEKEIKKKKKGIVLLDFCSVNMCKHIHMGHLKSIFLGYSLSNLFNFCNYQIKNRSHIGDWNLNIALVITFIIIFSNIHMNKDEREQQVLLNINSLSNKETNKNKFFVNTYNYNHNIKNKKKKDKTLIDEQQKQIINKQTEDFITQYIKLLNNINEQTYEENYNILDTKKCLNIKLDALEFSYRLSKRLYLKSDLFKKFSKNTLSLMYKKDEKIMTLWNIICNITKKENEPVLKRFNIKRLVEKGEHYYVKYASKIINMMIKKKVIFNLDNKLCVLLKPKDMEKMCTSKNYKNKENILKCNDIYYDIIEPDNSLYEYINKNDILYLKKYYTILTLKNDVAYTYAAIDLAAIYYRVTYEHVNKIIYVVDENQKNHFAQVFSIAKYLNLIKPNVECICINYGYILNQDKKKIKTQNFSNNIFVKDFFIKYKQNVQNFNDALIHLNNRNYFINNKYSTTKLYDQLFFSSTIYSYISVKNSKRQPVDNLIQNMNREYLYIIDTYNSTLYILNMFKNNNNNNNLISDFSFIFSNKEFQPEQNVKNLLLDIIKFNYIIQKCAHHFSIEKLCSYIYKLSQKIHNIYHNNNIFKNIIQNLPSKKKHKNIHLSTTNQNYQSNTLLNEQEINYTILSNYIKNNPNFYSSNIQSTTSEQQIRPVNNLMDNRILELIIMQSYIYILSKSFKILNLHLVKFH
ncbi:arginine--tRNA ligase, putative [Plasmodium reichenowi]|uniref:arginine--tRNA ligase n=1 Tax=Plasmodium reichenowi TaxID=5854 RepID=A0A2P9DCV7_PLARE|nr:arginine--tRNA ligase, putative [Plasmodium reichenowi]